MKQIFRSLNSNTCKSLDSSRPSDPVLPEDQFVCEMLQLQADELRNLRLLHQFLQPEKIAQNFDITAYSKEKPPPMLPPACIMVLLHFLVDPSEYVIPKPALKKLEGFQR